MNTADIMGIKLRQFIYIYIYVILYMTWSKRDCCIWKWKVHDLYTKSLIRM